MGLERKEVQVPRPSHCSDPDQTRHDEVMSNPLESSPYRPGRNRPTPETSLAKATAHVRPSTESCPRISGHQSRPRGFFLELDQGSSLHCIYAQLAVLGRFHYYLFSVLVVSMKNKIQCACIYRWSPKPGNLTGIISQHRSWSSIASVSRDKGKATKQKRMDVLCPPGSTTT